MRSRSALHSEGEAAGTQNHMAKLEDQRVSDIKLVFIWYFLFLTVL